MKMPGRMDLERLYDEHAQSLYAFLLNLTRDEADTRDLLQEIFVKLAREPRLLDGVREERAFLIRLAHNAAIDLMRRRRPTAKRDVDLTNGPGKLCLALGIGERHNWLPLQSPPITIRAGDPIADRDVSITPRIGISRSAEWPLRWIVNANPYVSKTPKHFSRTALGD